MSFVNWQFSAQQVYAWYIWCIHVHDLAILDKGGGAPQRWSRNCTRWYTVNYDTVNQYVPSITQCKLALSFITIFVTKPQHTYLEFLAKKKRGQGSNPLRAHPPSICFNGIFVLMITFPFILQNIFNRERHCGRKFLTDWFF